MQKHARLFNIFWALAHYFHYQWGYILLSGTDSIELYFALVCTGFAMLLLIFPEKLIYLKLLAISQISEFIYLSPDVPNHWTLTAFINLTVLLSFYKKDRWYIFFAYSAQKSIIIFYFFAFFWKLNTGFLNPEYSCANIFMDHITSTYLGLKLQGNLIVPVLTLLTELLIPLLLFFSGSRICGVILALCFHYFLALDVQKFFLNFSCVMFSLLFLFLPYRVVDKIKFRYINYLFAFTGLFLIIALQFNISKSWFIDRQIFWMLYGSFVLYLLVRSSQNLQADSRQICPTLLSFLIPVLVFLNGISPVLGFKTASAWQMYSNLEISDKDSNHYLIDKSLDLLDLIKNKNSNNLNLWQKKFFRIVDLNGKRCDW